METTDFSHIPGWGADLDHANRPAYPKERIPARDIGVHWSEPEQQVQNVPILHSNERPGITPVFGTTVPPKGISGRLRKFAFNFSENDIRHWLILLTADRINVVEGLFEDISRGHIPNIFSELGWRAEWKYNKKGLVKKLAIIGAVTGVGFYLLKRSRKR